MLKRVNVTYLMCFCYKGFIRQVFTLMFWGFVWFLTKTQISAYSHNPDYSQVQILSLELVRMIIILLRHLHEKCILWVN